MLQWLKNRRRKKIAAQPFPADWVGILRANVGLYSRLPEADQLELCRHILIFNTEKRFEGCGGLEITDEIRLTIAAQACILLLHRQTDYYPGLETILVYPEAYVVTHYEELEMGIIVEGPDVRVGESWHRGSIVLSWDDVRRGAFDIHDGHNVVLHEFAHQLDITGAKRDSTPLLARHSTLLTWARVLQNDFEQLQLDVSQGRPTVLDAYGAVDPAEFFAVATECFFEKPAELNAKHPALYDQLRLFYQQDPLKYT
jgi:Mlc titration factor MtfA (ptsG expression regulator)